MAGGEQQCAVIAGAGDEALGDALRRRDVALQVAHTAILWPPPSSRYGHAPAGRRLCRRDRSCAQPWLRGEPSTLSEEATLNWRRGLQAVIGSLDELIYAARQVLREDGLSTGNPDALRTQGTYKGRGTCAICRLMGQMHCASPHPLDFNSALFTLREL
ncbi:hypothetical protein GCM10011415_26460 [Salipiger pallidus]|uniref:Uncharacterized protein n=1 Tax=Salipiger pallidus TaxID=1775170 RepID=A0A8J2ZL74_9RHOB|nr:hypothetical protein GCM10011415_26460 [Salipiger pallidus]